MQAGPTEKRAYFRKLQRNGHERDFFARDLEAFHGAHEAHRAALKKRGAVRRGTNDERNAVETEIFNADLAKRHSGKRLSDAAHLMDHPVGRYLDRSRLGSHEDLLHGIQRVSVAPGGHKQSLGPYGQGHRVWYSGESSARHIEHGLNAHNLESSRAGARSAFDVRKR